MLKNYFKIAWRNLLKYKFHSLVNILGLSVGIAFTLLIGAYVWTELRVNTQLKHAENQYILQSKWKDPNQGLELTTIGALPKALKEEYPQLVANYYRWDGISVIASHNERYFEESCAIGDSTLLDMYGFELLYGNKPAAFNDPYSVVISAGMALKYFGTKAATGQTLTIQNFRGEKKDFIVTGVLKAVAKNSVTYINATNNNQLFLSESVVDFFGRNIDSWQNPFIAGYVELQAGVTPSMLEKPIKELLTKNTASGISENLEPYLVPLTEFYRTADNRIVQKLLNTLSFIALFILLMAMVNFVNSSISSAASRIREIGVRKALGSRKSQLLQQFLAESILLVFFATVLAVFIYQFCRPLFTHILETELPSVFTLPVYFMVIPLGLSLLIGILAGIYPSLILSSLKTVDSIKGKLQAAGKKVPLQKLLVGFQFCIAVVILTGTVIISMQVNYFFSKNLGYDKDFVVTAALPRDWTPSGLSRMETIRNEFTRMPEIESATLSYEIPNGMGNGGAPVLYRIAEDSTKGVTTNLLMADEHFSETYKIPLLTGAFFNKPGERYDSTRIVINETAAKALRWENPGNAVGQQVYAQGNPAPLTISGVVKDFHFASMQEKIQATCWVNVKLFNQYRYFSFRLRPGNAVASMNALQEKWMQLLPSAPVGYNFMDDTLEKLYKSEIQLKKAAHVATILSVLIVLLGILGLVSLSIQKRTKEIGIRKVLGATASQIVALFMKDFFGVFMIAVLVSCPLAWYLMSQWLNDYQYRIDITGLPFIISVGLLAGITSLLICMRTIKAALMNPVKSLKSE